MHGKFEFKLVIHNWSHMSLKTGLGCSWISSLMSSSANYLEYLKKNSFVNS